MGGRKPRSPVLVFEGVRYTWSPHNGSWRSTTSADRHNLARRIYERAYGPIAPGCKVVYLDGDRYNLDPSNLAALTHREAQLRRMQDPNYRDLAVCTALYGQLRRNILDKLDPSRRRESSRLAWKTRRERYGRAGGNKKRGAA